MTEQEKLLHSEACCKNYTEQFSSFSKSEIIKNLFFKFSFFSLYFTPRTIFVSFGTECDCISEDYYLVITSFYIQNLTCVLFMFMSA